MNYLLKTKQHDGFIMNSREEIELWRYYFKNPEYISPDTTLKEAAYLMREHDYGFLPIGENDRLIGMITDRDMAIRCVAEGWDPNTASVREAMTDKVLFCYQDDSNNNYC